MSMKRIEELFVGVDVAKAWLDLAGRVSNAEAGVSDLVQRMTTLQPTLIVFEATGGLETLAVAALAQAGLPVVVVNAKRVCDFARATGQLAKDRQAGCQSAGAFCGGRPPTRPPSPE
jgi:transposase